MSAGQHASHVADVTLATVTTAPPVGVASAVVLGLPISQWVVVLTLLQLFITVPYWLWRWRREYLKALREDAVR